MVAWHSWLESLQDRGLRTRAASSEEAEVTRHTMFIVQANSLSYRKHCTCAGVIRLYRRLTSRHLNVVDVGDLPMASIFTTVDPFITPMPMHSSVPTTEKGT